MKELKALNVLNSMLRGNEINYLADLSGLKSDYIYEAIEELEKINSCNDCKYDNDSLVDTLNKCESCKRYYQDKFEAKE